MKFFVLHQITNGNQSSFVYLISAANSPKIEKIYMHKIHLLTRNTILIIMKSKASSVDYSRVRNKRGVWNKREGIENFQNHNEWGSGINGVGGKFPKAKRRGE